MEKCLWVRIKKKKSKENNVCSLHSHDTKKININTYLYVLITDKANVSKYYWYKDGWNLWAILAVFL